MTDTIAHSSHADMILWLSIALWVAMLVCIELGRRFGIVQLRKQGKEARSGVGVVDGSIYAMLAFLIGFSFNGAAARFDQRRALVAAEVNAIGTAWQRIDLLAADQQAALRPLFRRYVDALIASYADRPESASVLLEPPALKRAQADVWSSTVALSTNPSGEKARVLLIPSINEMFGSIEQERLARRVHPPIGIFAVLALLSLQAAFFIGYAMAAAPRRNWMYYFSIATTIAVAMWVILELEYPRLGVIRVNSMDRALLELRESIQ